MVKYLFGNRWYDVPNINHVSIFYVLMIASSSSFLASFFPFPRLQMERNGIVKFLISFSTLLHFWRMQQDCSLWSTTTFSSTRCSPRFCYFLLPKSLAPKGSKCRADGENEEVDTYKFGWSKLVYSVSGFWADADYFLNCSLSPSAIPCLSWMFASFSSLLPDLLSPSLHPFNPNNFISRVSKTRRVATPFIHRLYLTFRQNFAC